MSLATDAREAIHHEYYRRWIVSVRGPTHGRPDAAPPRPLKAARRSLPLRAARTIVAVPALSMTPIRDRKVAFGRAALALRPAVAGTPTALGPPYRSRTACRVPAPRPAVRSRAGRVCGTTPSSGGGPLLSTFRARWKLYGVQEGARRKPFNPVSLGLPTIFIEPSEPK
jgi:hypothetical protein